MIFTTPEFLSELFRTIIIMSIIGSIVTLLLLFIKPIVRHRLLKSAQYYLWLIVIAALLVPVSRIIVLPTTVGSNAIHNVVERNVISADEARNRQIISMPDTSNALNFTLPAAEPMLPPARTTASSTESSPGFFTQAASAVMLIYPWVALFVVLFSIAGYFRFTVKLRKFNTLPGRFERALLKDLTSLHNIRRRPRMYRNTLAATPMLIGLFKPLIILPCKDYTQAQLHSILLHEIIHFKRLDIVIKWMSLLACAIHWFNPLVWVARREISRACELSCDEAVIRNMDNHAKQNYGETLICVAANSKTPLTVLSTTMCEEKRELKERLSSIMKSKKHTKLAVLASVFVFFTVTVLAFSLGSRTAAEGGISETDSNSYVGQNVTYNNAETISDGSPIFYAEEYIRNWADSFSGDFFTVTDTRLVSFEKVHEFDQFLSNPIELWRLDFHFKLEEGPEPIEEGQTFSNLDRLIIVWANDDDWIVEATATDPQGGGRYFVFERTGETARNLGMFYEHSWFMDVSTPEAAENTLREWLEHEGFIAVPQTENMEIGTPMTFAEEYIRNWADSFGGDFFTVTDTRIVNLEQVNVFDHFLENRVELWRLDFHFKLEEGPEPIEEGQTYSNFDRLIIIWANDDDWIIEATATDPHGGGHYLVFERINGYVRLLGSFFEHWQMDVSTPEAAENTLQEWLELTSALPISFNGIELDPNTVLEWANEAFLFEVVNGRAFRIGYHGENIVDVPDIANMWGGIWDGTDYVPEGMTWWTLADYGDLTAIYPDYMTWFDENSGEIWIGLSVEFERSMYSVRVGNIWATVGFDGENFVFSHNFISFFG